MRVTKRNGITEEYNLEKIHKILDWATEGISDVSVSEIEMRVEINLFDGIGTDVVHDSLIEAASDLISVENPNYAFVASRLLNFKIRKDVWGGKNPPRLYDLLKLNVEKGFYSKSLLESYSEKDINKIGEIIDHERDYLFDYGGLVQMVEKYLVQDRFNQTTHETPQFTFVVIAMFDYMYEAPEERLKFIKLCYDYVSRFKINLPTPVLSGARTPTHSFSSCCLIDVLDTKNSLMAAVNACALTTCDKYGIGLNLSRIRPINSPIKNGESLHSGIIAWLKIFQSTIAACQQGGARRGAGTITFPIFTPEIISILELKNNQGTHENRVPHLDYSIATSNLFYDRLKNNGHISLFGSDVVPDLYEAFGLPEFDSLYTKYEKEGKAHSKVEARELFKKMMTETLETGRIYAINVDQANQYTAWGERVVTGNLCQEVLTPLVSEAYPNDPDAEIGVCVLGAINMLNIKSDAEHSKACAILVRFLDNVITIQDYAVQGCRNFAQNKRSLGIGLTNLAAWLASKGINHDSPEAPQMISDFLEKQQYYLMSASCHLAQERGAAPHWEKSKYYAAEHSPLDLYNKNVDSFLDPKPKMDWDTLMRQIKEFGMRNMTLSAQMPCQSSSIIQNSTNGIEPINSLLIRKTSKTKTTTQTVPSVKKWKNKYLLRNDIKNNDGIIKVVAAVTKWMDMGVSGNLYYNSANYEDGNVPLSVLIKDRLTATKYGWRTFYYTNSAKKNDPLAEQPTITKSNAPKADDENTFPYEIHNGWGSTGVECEGGACTL